MESTPAASGSSSSSHAASRSALIVALDFPSAAAALDLVGRLEARVLWFKVGLQLYLAAGPSIVDTLRARGFHVFVDLKLHDIPNTVAGAVDSLCSAGANLVTLHACGGRPMLLAAAEAASRHAQPPGLLGVTVLTSMDVAQLNDVGVPGSVPDQVLRLARVAREAGLAGIVCSPQEVGALRLEFGPDPLLVVPGIRPAGAAVNDQKRVATPAEAVAAGASHLVVGRPITHAPHPAAAVELILDEIASASRIGRA